jgi:quinol monooxygenase YgiN/mannose-6-phosphate isomerase-like protein (cupin superfamily)
MTKVSRYAKATAQPGQGDALAENLLRAANATAAGSGCELYVVNRALDDPDVIWVTEVWSDQAALDASLQTDEAQALIAETRPLIASMELIELEPLGGVGLDVAPRAEPDFTIRNLRDSEDMAVRHGFSDMGEVRFPSDDLRLADTGVSHQLLAPGKRQAFAHRHRRAEEVYVVLAGSGRVKIDDELVEIGPRDAIRIAPALTRAFEAGPEGLELLAFGPRRRGDGEVIMDWWTD